MNISTPQFNIVYELARINESLAKLTDLIGAQSFWNSPFFAAIMGSGFTLMVIIIGFVIKWYLKRRDRLYEIYLEIIVDYNSFTPSRLFDAAQRRTYLVQDPETNSLKDDTKKPIGQKMVNELRTNIKYWKYPSSKLKRLYKKYMKSLLNFSNCNVELPDELKGYFSNADCIF